MSLFFQSFVGSKSRLAKAAGAEHISTSKVFKPAGKSACRCDVKHLSKSKVLKTDGVGAFLDVEMSKMCGPL